MNTASKQDLISRVSIRINAPVSKVWQALVTPALIKQYLFGTEAASEWKKGSSITFKGEWEGKKYQDKGTIINIEPNKQLHHTYWSSMSNLEDKPENYKNIIYDLSVENGATVLTITQDNNETEKAKEHSEQNWRKVADSIKEMLEKP